MLTWIMFGSAFKISCSALFATSIASLEKWPNVISIQRRNSLELLSMTIDWTCRLSTQIPYRIIMSVGIEASICRSTFPCNEWRVMRSTTIFWNRRANSLLRRINYVCLSFHIRDHPWPTGSLWTFTSCPNE